MATISFDRVNKFVLIDTGAPNEVLLQEIYDESMDWIDEPSQMDLPNIMTAEGKKAIGGGDLTGIVLTMLQGWKLKFLDEAGPTTVQKIIRGGDLALIGGVAPIEPSDFVFVVIGLSTAPAIAGSILTQVDEIHKVHGLDTGNPLEVEDAQRRAGATIIQDITDNGTTATVTRQ
jgi:hypothetical protein